MFMDKCTATELSKTINGFNSNKASEILVCKIPLLARCTRPSAAPDDRISCIQATYLLES